MTPFYGALRMPIDPVIYGRREEYWRPTALSKIVRPFGVKSAFKTRHFHLASSAGPSLSGAIATRPRAPNPRENGDTIRRGETHRKLGPSDLSVGFERLTNNASTARDAKDAKESNSVKPRLSQGNGPVATQILARGLNTHLILAFGFPWRPWRPLRLTLGRNGLETSVSPSDQFFNTRAPITYTNVRTTEN